jgi:hypothetical protein
MNSRLNKSTVEGEYPKICHMITGRLHLSLLISAQTNQNICQSVAFRTFLLAWKRFIPNTLICTMVRRLITGKILKTTRALNYLQQGSVYRLGLFHRTRSHVTEESGCGSGKACHLFDAQDDELVLIFECQFCRGWSVPRSRSTFPAKNAQYWAFVLGDGPISTCKLAQQNHLRASTVITVLQIPSDASRNFRVQLRIAAATDQHQYGVKHTRV